MGILLAALMGLLLGSVSATIDATTISAPLSVEDWGPITVVIGAIYWAISGAILFVGILFLMPARDRSSKIALLPAAGWILCFALGITVRLVLARFSSASSHPDPHSWYFSPLLYACVGAIGAALLLRLTLKLAKP
jgi:hypothetical protein